MNIFGKPLNLVNEDDLKLIKNEPQFQETQSIEYKEFFENIKQNDKKKEFIKDITAMANSFGGLLIYGVQENKGTGLPNAVDGQDSSKVGIEHANIDKLKNSIQEIILSNTEPVLKGVRIHPVPLATGNFVFIFDIPKSPSLPHRCKLDNHFYYRYDTISRSMSVDEIRALMTNSESFRDKLEKFRNDRIGNIASGKTPIALNQGPKTVLHIFPASAINSKETLDLQSLSTVLDEDTILVNKPNLIGLCQYKPNTGKYLEEGLCAYYDYYAQYRSGYTLVYYSGAIEVVESEYFSPYGRQAGIRDKYFSNIVDKSVTLLKLLHELETVGPYWIALSMLYIQNIQLFYPEYPTQPIRSRHLALESVAVESFDSNPGKALMPVFDKIWQAAGCPKAFLNERYEW